MAYLVLRKMFFLFFVSFLALPQVVFPAGFTLSCISLDPVLQQQKSSFQPGSKMLLRFTFDVPQEAIDRQINVKIAARLRVSGLNIPITLDDMKFSFTNQSPSPADSGKELPISGIQVADKTIKIPSGFPGGSFKLMGKASIEGVGKE